MNFARTSALGSPSRLAKYGDKKKDKITEREIGFNLFL
jgi:hypothetical protein